MKIYFFINYYIIIMKILHLVLYSETEHYAKMKSITSEFYKTYNAFVDTYYYYFDNTMSSNLYELQDNNLKIKGSETFIPGILDKTIKAFEYFKNTLNTLNNLDNYDYIIRSNISTVINFDKILNILSDKYYDYGFYLFNRQKYKFSSGTSILLSNKMIHFILNNKNKLDYETIDDVAIGIILYENIDTLKFCNIRHKVCFNYTKQPINNYIIFRNKTKYNRNKDIFAIKKITNAILRAKQQNIQTENTINKIIKEKTDMKTYIKIDMTTGMTTGMKTGMKTGMTTGMKTGMKTGMRISMKTGMRISMKTGMMRNIRKVNIRRANIRRINIRKANIRRVNIYKSIKKFDKILV